MRVSTRLALIILMVAALCAGIACSTSRGDTSNTQSMPQRLLRITEQTDPRDNPFMNSARAAQMEAVLRGQGESPNPRLLEALGRELLNAGRTEEALARFAQLEQMMRAHRLDPHSRLWRRLRLEQAVASLRRAEDENCSLHHNPRSCLFPIRDAGVHTRPRGSRAAAAILTELLEQSPDDLQSRWLLNIAFMTLGEYPDGVPSRWRLAPGLFQSDYDIKPFHDIAADIALDVDDLAGGSIIDDFDGDGNLDIMASAMGFHSQLRYFHNEADGTFTEKTREAGILGEFGGLNIMQTDYDNDGWIDVLVLRGGWLGRAGHYPPSLLHNEGNATFIDVTEKAGLLSLHPTQTATWFDFNGDGWLDLYIGNESTEGDPNPCQLYQNNRDGTFTERAREAGVAFVGFVKGVTSGDFNNDGRPDLYLSVRGGPNLLYRNDGASEQMSRTATQGRPWRFTDVAASAGVTEPIFSFPTWFWDYDNDGWEDIFVSGYLIKDVGDVAADALGLPHEAELPRLYRNNGDGTFTDESRATHLDHILLAMGSNYGDLDNDGWLDFYVGTGNPNLETLLPNRMFRNAEGRTFQDVTTSGGFGHLQKGHGVSFGDLDNDGDQDIYHVVGGAVEGDHFRNALFENPGHGNHWIALKLEGVRSNRPGIGARLKVVVQTSAGERAIYKTVRSGGSFGASPLRQEIGLGAATRILRVEIRWPAGGEPQVLRNLEMDSRYLVREGEANVRPIPLRGFSLGSGGARQD